MTATIDVKATVIGAFRQGRVLSVTQRGWVVTVRVMADPTIGPVRLTELANLCGALDVAPACVTVLEAGRGVVEVQLDLDHQAPSRCAAGSDSWFAD